MIFILTITLLSIFHNVSHASIANLSVFPRVQDMPSIACPDKFEYVSWNNSYTGKITIYGALLQSIKVEALFSQQQPITKNYDNGMELIESVTITESNLLNGKPITYGLDFPDPLLLPKLIRLRVNERTICADNSLIPFGTKFTAQHIFYPSLETLTRSTQLNRLRNPFNTTTVMDAFDALAPPPTTITNLENICGQVDANLTSSATINNEYEYGRFPWLTAIYALYLPMLRFMCTGTLISTRTVVTAARCFLDPDLSVDRLVVYLGLHNLYAPESGAEQRDIEFLIKHPDFKPSGEWADANIALLHMRTPISFTQFIRPICLWSSSAALTTKIGYNVKWVSDRTNIIKSAAFVPKLFEVDIVGEVECLRSNEISHLWTTPRTLCAGKLDGSVACAGGAGSGLMINFNGRWILRAVFTSGVPINEKTCKPNDYGIYSDLSKHATWVRRNMLL